MLLNKTPLRSSQITYPAVIDALAIVVVPRMDLLNRESLLTSSCKAFREVREAPEKIDSNGLAAISAEENLVLTTFSEAFSNADESVVDSPKI